MEEPTQVRHSWNAALRTAVQVFAGVLIAAQLLAEVLPLLTEDLGVFLPEAWSSGLLAFAAFCAALAAALAKVMAIKRVNDFLKHFGLGAED